MMTLTLKTNLCYDEETIIKAGTYEFDPDGYNHWPMIKVAGEWYDLVLEHLDGHYTINNNGWIKSSDRLPEKEGCYIGAFDLGFKYAYDYVKWNGEDFVETSEDYDDMPVTKHIAYWHELPELPQYIREDK